MQPILLKNIISLLEKWAPKSWAQSYDHVGLQLGDLYQPVTSILVVVDINNDVLEFIAKNPVDLIITHHPLIFTPLDSIQWHTPFGKIIADLIRSNTALYAMHTNLDIAPDGVNDCLIKAYGFDPKLGKLIRPQTIDPMYKIFVFVPIENAFLFREKILSEIPAKIGNYKACSFSTSGEGTFFPLEEANPTIGKCGELSKVTEIKLEFLVSKSQLQFTLDMIRKHHTYEEPAIDVFEEKILENKLSYAKYFKFKEGLSTTDLIQKFLCRLRGASLSDRVKVIAFGCGNGRSVIQDLINLEVELYITGEIDYHSEQTCLLNGISVLELGHRESESFIIPEIKTHIQNFYSNINLF